VGLCCFRAYYIFLMDSYAAHGLAPDFQVSYTLYSAEEGGRNTPVRQHIRWDFRYEDSTISTNTFMIWSEILRPNGELLLDEYMPMHGLTDMFILFLHHELFISSI
jgi:hypothetical protein